MEKTVSHKFELPTIFVIFGVTGDLMRRKILRALYTLHLKGLLPRKFQVFGLSRRELDDTELREYLRAIMREEKLARHKEYERFLSSFSYIKGDFGERDTYQRLARILGSVDGQWRVCTNKLFYLAVPPAYYRTILEELKMSGLTIPCSPTEGWTRVILEKPFGTDLKSALELDSLLGSLFREEQIYRVDHYLAKETVRNILAFRFSNSFLTPAWNNRSLEKIEIKLLEKSLVSQRGEFYDKTGTLRDVGQNHLLQLLTLFTMDNPHSFTPESIRAARSDLLRQLRIYEEKHVMESTVRGQYRGYREEKGVNRDSQTETYFRIRVLVDKNDFYSVPIYLESGKAMNQSLTEITLTFKHKTPCLCPPNQHFQNSLVYTIFPEEKITTRFLVKKPGYGYTLSPQNFEFDYRKVYQRKEFIEEYEQLLLDIITGDQTLFVSTEEILSQWKFVEPILECWRKGKPELVFYPVHHCPKVVIPIDQELKHEIGVVGLGKMGTNLSRNLISKGWRVVGYNRTREKAEILSQEGLQVVSTLKELVEKLHPPRIIWLMLTAGAAVDETLFNHAGLVHFLDKGDIVIDAGNSYYEDSERRGERLAEEGISFVDVGVSGGPEGARHGMSLMVGGDRETYNYLKPLFLRISVPGGLGFFPGIGAGHFVKMVHNGIEYGMMQSIAEGFNILKNSAYHLDLTKISRVYNNGSVIESRLIGWLKEALDIYGEELSEVLGTVGYTGEGEWTVTTARKMKLKAQIIKEALKFRIDSKENPSYTGKILSALRSQFGKHSIK